MAKAGEIHVTVQLGEIQIHFYQLASCAKLQYK
jgi:hypothetical protein